MSVPVVLRVRAGVEDRAPGEFIAEVWVETWVDGRCVERRCFDNQTDPWPTHAAALARARELVGGVARYFGGEVVDS